ncbi:MAG: hypothetical protein ABL857_01865 [Rickettsiales bacterium]
MPVFTSLIRSQSQNNVVLYRAITADGRDFYAYIKCNKKQEHKMKHDFETNTGCNGIADYGEVIYSAFGKNPDSEAEAFLAEYLKNM